MPVAIINSNNIADWCSNDRQILVTPSCFAARVPIIAILLDVGKYILISSEVKRNGLAAKHEGVTSICRSFEHQSAILLLLIIATGISAPFT
jgi:hypothetical protein